MKQTQTMPSKPTLILVSALLLTLLFSLPRLAVLRSGQTNTFVDFTWPDFLAKSMYCFLVTSLFLFINLQNRRINFEFFVLDFQRLFHLIFVNILLFICMHFLLMRFHQTFIGMQTGERLFRFLFNLNMILEVLFSILLARIYKLVFSNHQMQLTNESLLKMNAETQYEVLKNQINPHFLFNSFNTLNALISRDKESAQTFVNNMSDVFRYVLKNSQVNLVSVEAELKFVEAYIQMLKGRYADGLRIETSIPPEWMHRRLPPMTMQILLENVVKHNIVSANHPLAIHIYVDEGRLVVSNNLRERKLKEPSTGMGLYNLDQRCQYLSGKEIVIKRTGDVFSVEIPLI